MHTHAHTCTAHTLTVTHEGPQTCEPRRGSRMLRSMPLKVLSLSGPLTEDGRLRGTSGSGDTALHVRPAVPPGAGVGGWPHRFGPLPQAAVLEVRVVGQRPARAQLDPGQQLHASRKHSRPRGVRAKRRRERCREPPGFPGTSSAMPTVSGAACEGRECLRGGKHEAAPRTSPF